MKKQDCKFLLELIEKELGWKFDKSSFYMLDKKISSFVRSKNYLNVDELIAEIKTGNRLLLEQLSEDLAHIETHFFRDFDVYSRFSKLVLPSIKDENRAVKKLSIWSCGCSTGQEVYSILIALKENGFLDNWQVHIVGTDFSAKALAEASKGVYNNFEIQAGNNIKTIVENFNQKDYGWQIKSELASHVEFRRFNLLDQLLFKSKFDIVFCRNTVKYFTLEKQKEIIEKVRSTQSVGGLLYLGVGEEIEGLDGFYEKVVGFECLYQAKKINSNKSSEDMEDKGGVVDIPRFKKPDSLEGMF